MKIQRFICAILMLGAVLASQSASAQLKTSYFMEGSYFRTDMNPALAPTRGYIAIPVISGYSFGTYSNYASYMHFYRNGEYVNGYSPLVSSDEFLTRLPNKCTQAVNLDMNLFRVGFYTLSGAFWNVGSNFRVALDSSTPKEYFKILKNDTPNGTTAENMRYHCNAYLENYIGRTFRLGENITIGARVKFLVGLLNMSLDVNKISANNNQFYVDGAIKTAGILYDSSHYDGEIFPEVLDSGSLSTAKCKSFGGAIDLGAEVRLLDNHLKLSGAITDLGIIKWSKDTMIEGSLKMTYDNKDDVENILNLIDEEIIQLPRIFSDYTSRLVTNINLGAEYNFLSNHFAVGVLSSTRILHGSVMSEFTASLNVRPTNWISLTASQTLLNGNEPGIYGLAVNLHPKAINIFFGMDYITGDIEDTYGDFLVSFPAFDAPEYPSPNSFNFYIGVGFNFGRPDFLIEQ